MFIIKHKAIFFGIAIILMGISLVSMIIRGFNVGVDFTGGSLLELSYQGDISFEFVRESIQTSMPDAVVQKIGEHAILVRTSPLSPEEKNTLLASLERQGDFAEERFTTIGPSVGSELARKSILALAFVSLAIILFIAYVFRKVSRPVSSWAYGVIAVLVLVHDVMIPAGIFSWFGLPVDTLFVVGLLTILGVSVNDTIVVFDRIREHLRTNEEKHLNEDFATLVGKSIRDTMTRSIMTSLTVLVALLALVFFGPVSTRNLALVMFLGMFFGTYSSIFIASPLLVVWEKMNKKKQ